MANSNIKMDPQMAIRCGNQISEAANTYNTEIKKIYGIVSDLKSSWTGSAAQRFVDGIESYKEDYEKFGKLIDEFGELLTAIGKDYQALEEDL